VDDGLFSLAVTCDQHL